MTPRPVRGSTVRERVVEGRSYVLPYGRGSDGIGDQCIRQV